MYQKLLLRRAPYLNIEEEDVDLDQVTRNPSPLLEARLLAIIALVTSSGQNILFDRRITILKILKAVIKHVILVILFNCSMIMTYNIEINCHNRLNSPRQ